MKKSWKSKIVPYLFLTPTFIFLAVFSYYSIGNAVYTSFTNAQLGRETQWVGLSNYINAFHDEMFLVSFRNQVVITVAAVVFSVFFPVLASELLFFIKHKRVANIIKTAFVIPMLVPQIVVILIWKFLYSPNFGFNTILEEMHMSGITHNWLNDPDTALYCVAILTAWLNSGINFLYFSAGLGNIDETIYERASVDGASSVQKFFSLTLPGLSPIMFYTLVVNIIQAFQSFGQIKILTEGGPDEATNVIVYSIYRDAFFNYRFGSAAAQSVVLFIIIMLITLVMFRIEKKGVSY